MVKSIAHLFFGKIFHLNQPVEFLKIFKNFRQFDIHKLMKLRNAKNSNSYHETRVSGRSRRHEGQEACLRFLVCSSSSHPRNCGDPQIAFTNRQSRTNRLKDRSYMLIWLLKIRPRRDAFISYKFDEDKYFLFVASESRVSFTWPEMKMH